MPPKLPPTSCLDLSGQQVEPRQFHLSGGQPEGGLDQQNQHAGILLEEGPRTNALSAKLIDLESAVTAKLRSLKAKAKVHQGTVLEAKKIEMYDRWKKGLDILPLRNLYRDPVSKLTPSAKAVQHALRFGATTREDDLRRTIDNQRRVIQQLTQRRTG